MRHSILRSLMRCATIPFVLSLLLTRAASATGTDWPIVGASASSGNPGAANVFDNDTGTNWSSAVYSTAQHSESIQISFSGAHPVNYIKFGTVHLANQAYGFPFEFTVSWYDGVTWWPLQTFTHFPAPTAQWISLALPDVASATSPPAYAPAQATAVKVTANVLGPINGSSPTQYAFVLSELRAGYDPAQADTTITPYFSAGSSELWPASNVQDGNASTAWSSVLHSSSTTTESIQIEWPYGVMQSMNAIRLLPRYSNGAALGFPINFSINYSDGATWQPIASYTNFPTPRSGDWIILPFGRSVMGNGLQVTATTLGSDGYNYVFQMAEMQGEFSPALGSMSWSSNNGASVTFDVQNVGSDFIDRLDQINVWRKDVRGREEFLPPLNPTPPRGSRLTETPMPQALFRSAAAIGKYTSVAGMASLGRTALSIPPVRAFTTRSQW